MAAGMGIVGRQVSEPEELVEALGEALASGEPRLIDVLIEGKT
jgi:thiamine pyrophosphate-dependent acetolactate synthase large subunit-like protein